MANLDAVQRAAEGGGVPSGIPGQAPGTVPGAAPQAGIDPAGQLVSELEGVRAFIETQMSEGNPAATQAMQALQGLVQSMAEMSGAEPPMGGGPPEPGGAPSPGGGQVPLGQPQGAQVL